MLQEGFDTNHNPLLCPKCSNFSDYEETEEIFWENELHTEESVNELDKLKSNGADINLTLSM